MYEYIYVWVHIYVVIVCLINLPTHMEYRTHDYKNSATCSSIGCLWDITLCKLQWHTKALSHKSKIAPANFCSCRDDWNSQSHDTAAVMQYHLNLTQAHTWFDVLHIMFSLARRRITTSSLLFSMAQWSAVYPCCTTSSWHRETCASLWIGMLCMFQAFLQCFMMSGMNAGLETVLHTVKLANDVKEVLLLNGHLDKECKRYARHLFRQVIC